MLSSSGWTAEIMLLCIMAGHTSPPTNLGKSSQYSGPRATGADPPTDEDNTSGPKGDNAKISELYAKQQELEADKEEKLAGSAKRTILPHW